LVQIAAVAERYENSDIQTKFYNSIYHIINVITNLMHLIHRLKLNHIRLIVKIAEVQKLQFAANSMGMSQPAASRILKEIEADIGAPLFVRQARGMEVSELGKAFLRHARVILSQLDSLETEIADLNAGDRGEIAVGSVTGPAVSNLVPAVEALKRAAPGVRVSIEIGPSYSLLRGLEEGQFDFVLGRLPHAYDGSEFDLLPGRQEDVVLMAHDTHPLAGQHRVTLAQVQNYEWVIQDRGTPIRKAVEGAFYALGLRPPANVTNSSSLLVALAMLRNRTIITPQTREVAELLTDDNIGSRICVLPLADSIRVPVFYAIKNRHRQMNRIGQGLLDDVLRRM
jgi:DNA-binding transcriptional LysR family regulator